MKKKSLNVKKINLKNFFFKLADRKITKIYTKFKKNIDNLPPKSKLSAAISGGPDSMALAYLLKLYSLENKLNIKYFHIDHGLRNSSSYEAMKIKKKLKSFGMELKILKWRGIKPTSNIQSKSRQARYNLLSNSISSYILNLFCN